MKRTRDQYVEGIALGVAEVPAIPKKPARYLCRNCQRDVTLDTRMSCAVCPGFWLCLTCFSVGAELAPHKATHDYHVHSSAHFPLYSADWGADEELLLLEGTSLYGLGNWPDVADHVGTKTADECGSHFFAAYVDTPTFPLPVDPLPEQTIRASLPMPLKQKIVEKKIPFKPGLSLPVKPNLGSFMPLRGEFDNPFNESAEDIPADIVFNEDDNDEERAVKVCALQAFAGMLQERKRRTEFLVKHDLLDWKQHQLFDRQLEKEDVDVMITMRAMLQFIPKKEWEKFVAGVLAERRLRREIASHTALREAGLKSLGEVGRVGAGAAGGAAGGKKRFKSSASSSSLIDPRHNLRSSGVRSDLLEPSLSAAENSICESFGLSPQMYIMAKEACIRESCRAGMLGKKDARRLVHLAPHIMDHLYTFFVASGWVRKEVKEDAGGIAVPVHSHAAVLNSM